MDKAVRVLIQFSMKYDKEDMFKKKRCNTCGKKNKKVRRSLCLDCLTIWTELKAIGMWIAVCKSFHDKISLR